MTINLDKAIIELSRRGTEGEKPKGSQGFFTLEDGLSLRLGYDFRSVYSKIDGFRSYDDKSQLMIWGIDAINDNKESYPAVTDIEGTKWMSIGDFLIESDIIVAAVENENATVKLRYENRILSAGIANFICEIAAGKFDFL